MLHYIVEDTSVTDEGEPYVTTVPFPDHDSAIDWAAYRWDMCDVTEIDMYSIDQSGYTHDFELMYM